MSETIDALVSRGFRDAGYKFFQIDCGWQSLNGTRGSINSFGAIDYDQQNFPQGIRPISDKARQNGFTFSMYSDAGVRSCDSIVPSKRLGSYGHEAADAKQFADWNVEYVKYDYCYPDSPDPSNNAPKDPRTDFVDRYRTMWNALQTNKIYRMLVCQWGTPFRSSSGNLQGPSQWTDPVSTSFRLSDDINKDWAAVTRIINQSIHIANSGITGKGHFADADMLEVGAKELTIDEQASHFAYWAMAKSALMIGSNVASMPDASLRILQNKALIAINQDALAKPVKLVQRWTGDRDLFRGPLQNGDEAVLLINLRNQARNDLSIDLAKSLGIQSATIENLWTGQKKTGAMGVYSVGSLGARGSAPLRLSNIQRIATPNVEVIWSEAESASLSGGASSASCSGCSGGTKVGNVGNGGAVTFNNVVAKSTTSTLLFDYINADIGYLAGQGQNARSLSISVNGAAAQNIDLPISGYDWSADVAKNFRVELKGFKQGNGNTLTLSNPSSFGPDIDRVGVIQA
ncbi:carbohydrate-binding module family 35 protein [Ceraceosorus bombacis]|uniref:Alpha-galactosidase n=1 Tax=Ceraceosorus bombacis TaxID=401625 RepID=A0A0P1BHQ6_9BASI|nr:carbohydrate-binding module family 35 protein [Ceraceosorus bombacis]